jgi:hypothetical protein
MTVTASGSSSAVAGLEPGEPVHRDDLHSVTPGLGAVREPGLERGLGAALDHVEQPGWAGAVADAGQVDDHGDVLVTGPGVAPHVLVDADRGDAVEASRVVDQGPFALGQDGVIGGIPRDRQPFSDPGHRQVRQHDRLQSPPQPTP